MPLLGSNILQSLNGLVNAVGWQLSGEGAHCTQCSHVMFFLGLVFGISMAATILIGQAVGGAILSASSIGGHQRFLLCGSVRRRFGCRLSADAAYSRRNAYRMTRSRLRSLVAYHLGVALHVFPDAGDDHAARRWRFKNAVLFSRAGSSARYRV